MSNPSKFWKLGFQNVTSSKKAKTHFKETKDFIFNNEIKMLKYEYKVPKSKDQRRVRHHLSILFLLGS